MRDRSIGSSRMSGTGRVRYSSCGARAGIGETALLEHMVANACSLESCGLVEVESEMELAFAGLLAATPMLVRRPGTDAGPAARSARRRFGYGGAAADASWSVLQCEPAV